MNSEQQHVCPWWLGYLLINPFRRLYHNPEKLFRPYINPGMRILDYGCAMGYFSLPLARLTGEGGRVICADIQEKMIRRLQRRAAKSGLDKQIETRLIDWPQELADLQNSIDFALLFAVVHEVPDKSGLFKILAEVLKPGATLFLSEPRGHVTATDFTLELDLASNHHLIRSASLSVNGSHAALLKRI